MFVMTIASLTLRYYKLVVRYLKGLEAWEHSLVGKCLPCKHEDLSSVALVPKLGVVIHSYNSSAEEVQTGGA